MAFEKQEVKYCDFCHLVKLCYGITSQSFGADENEVIVNTDFKCSTCGNVVETLIDVEPFIEISVEPLSEIPSQDQLRTEIIDILKREWRYDESAAIEQSDSIVFYAARRKYHYLKARGRVDQFTPSLPRVTASEQQHFATDEAAQAWLLYQQAPTVNDEPKVRQARRSRRASHSDHARPRAKRAHAASL